MGNASDSVLIEWRDVVGYEGYYQVSNHGHVRSLTRMIQCGDRQAFQKGGRLLKLDTTKVGYHRVELAMGAKAKKHGVHRLVAMAFIPNPDNKPQVNHKDGNKINNSVNNLEWVTTVENIRHAFSIGLKKGLFGNKNGAAKYSEERISELIEFARLNKKHMTYLQIGKVCGVHGSYIQQLVTKKRRPTHVMT